MQQDVSTTITQWIDAYSAALYARALYLLSDPAEAEDLLQEVFLAALEGYASYRNDSQPKTWLMQILNHKVADLYRKKYKKSTTIRLDQFFDETGSWKEDIRVLQDWNEAEVLLNNLDFSAALDHCLEELPARWKIPLQLYYLQEKKAKEVCQEIGISTTNLWKILQRSRLQLRQCLDINWFNPQK
ncbi:sigma-70 family RNA polymerase sigma factor [Sphingobacterium sp. Mn56C]|uniref:sigma-70 family RNA polymerase sigma factor n=1 Tax=Sphingobacterium sp. Mn56C TaxID=3395261 RepID=UPI003BCAFC6D